MLTVLALVCTLLAPPTVTAHVVVAGDSVIATFALVDNAVAQPVAVDSVEFTTTAASVTQTVRVAKQAGTTTARFAFALALWTPNNTEGGPVSVRLGRIAPACAGGVCWSGPANYGSPWFWSYLLDATAPNAPDGAAVTVQSVTLN